MIDYSSTCLRVYRPEVQPCPPYRFIAANKTIGALSNRPKSDAPDLVRHDPGTARLIVVPDDLSGQEQIPPALPVGSRHPATVIGEVDRAKARLIPCSRMSTDCESKTLSSRSVPSHQYCQLNRHTDHPERPKPFYQTISRGRLRARKHPGAEVDKAMGDE